ncbi:MAG TPA: carboxypeptidase-like regulatory domain-containing protein, partial [Planctomycetota bacterium]|nr:carboxypeptidase-like regulatory domain-containing protein [Planctomycetota bacterium]
MRILPTSAVPHCPFGWCLLAAALATPVAAQTPAAPVVRDVRGTVSGAGDEKVRVTLWHNDTQSGLVDAAAEAFAAADGSFAFRAVPWFEKQQWGFHSFLVLARTEKRIGVLTVRGDTVDSGNLRIDLGEASEVHGVVRSKETGLPLADVQVWARILGNPTKPGLVWLVVPLPLWTAVTDAEGRFLLKGLPKVTPLHLMAGNLEYARTPIQVDDPSKPVEAVLPLGGKVRGMVRMPDGKPAVRVRVRTTSNGAGYGETLTGDDGAFCLSALEAGVYKVWAEAPDLTVIAVVGLDVAAGAV